MASVLYLQYLRCCKPIIWSGATPITAPVTHSNLCVIISLY